MLEHVRAWLQGRRARLQERRNKQAAVERALARFRETHGVVPINGYALAHDAQRTIVRVTYLTDHIPPDRAWFAVSGNDDEVRELSFNEVARLETPWR
jgi:hypothetical protein